MKRCPNNEFHTTLNDNDKYCSICGALLEDSNKCKFCGRELHPIDNFCPNCGKPTK